MDQPLTVTNPEGHKTAFTYDDASRLATTRLPRGFTTPPPPALAYVTAYVYDGLDRVVSEIKYAEDGVASRRTHYCYDGVGDLRWVTAPSAGLPTARTDCPAGTWPNCPAGSPPAYTKRSCYDEAHRLRATTEALGASYGVERTTSYAYDMSGNLKTATNEMGTDTSFNYTARNELEKKTETFIASPLRQVTTASAYDRVGNMIRQVSPRAWDNAGGQDPGPGGEYVTEFRYDAVNQVDRIALPDDLDPLTPRTYLHRQYDANGNLTLTTMPVRNAELNDPPPIPADRKTELTYWDPGWIRTSDDHVNALRTFGYRPEGWQASRSICASRGCDERTWTYTPDGLVSKLAIESWRGAGNATYLYDENNNLKEAHEKRGQMSPTSSAYSIYADHNGFDETTETRQGPDNAPADLRYTDYRYDLNGNADRRWDDGTGYRNGREHDFSYDEADQLRQDFDVGPNPSVNTDDQVTDYDYFLTGWDKQKKVSTGAPPNRPIQLQTDYEYYLNGNLKKLSTKNKLAVTVESHELDYRATVGGRSVYMNGHRVTDLFRLTTPTDIGQLPTPCTSDPPNCTTTYTYGPRDNLLKSVEDRPGANDPTSTWEYDDALNVKRESIRGGAARRFVYAGDRLSEEQNDSQVTQARYFYDPVGNLECVTNGPGSSTACPNAFGGSISSNLIAKYKWDYLDRLESFHGYSGGGETDSATYENDPLNRVVKQTETHSGPARTTCFSYVGITSAISQERRLGTGSNPCTSAPTSTKSFSFDADLERISMTVTGTGPTNDGDYFFGRNVHGDPSLLLRATNGSVKSSYGYLPYGQADNDFTREPLSQPANDPFNSYRFNDRRLDSGSGSQDMGARRYSSGLGGGRFLEQDGYAGAEDDLGLALDPLSMGRYAFAGGNPLSFVETDGHAFAAGDSTSGASRQTTVLHTDPRRLPDSRDHNSSARRTSAPALRPLPLRCAPYKASVCSASEGKVTRSQGNAYGVAGIAASSDYWAKKAAESARSDEQWWRFKAKLKPPEGTSSREAMRYPRGQFRNAARGARSFARGASAAKWASRGLAGAGGVITGGDAGLDQWSEDQANPDLTRNQRRGRAIYSGIVTGGFSVAGGVAAGAGCGAVSGGLAAAPCAVAGAWVGEKAGGFVAEQTVDVVDDIDLTPWS
ncbi:MAG: hypothetical protein AABM30_03295 [Actinomycetota bacterium]